MKAISYFKKTLSLFFNTKAAGLYILLFAGAIGIATFIENDFGTSAAQKIIYKSWWFTLLLSLFSISIVVNIIRFRMIPQKKWALLTFHLAIIIILIGAGITRYFGYEGIMHIRENHTSKSFLSSETFLQFKINNGEHVYEFDEEVLFASIGNNNWHGTYQINNNLLEVRLKDFIPNPVQVIKDSPDGLPMLKVVLSGGEGREEYYITRGETRAIRNLTFNFSDTQISGAINIIDRNDSLLINYNEILTQMVMATQQVDTLYPSQGFHALKFRSLYSNGVDNFVFSEFNKKGEVSIESVNDKVSSESVIALKLELNVNGASDEIMVYGQQGIHGQQTATTLNGMNIAVSYGSKHVELPFSIKLFDFIMEKYPGTNSAASYASEVQLIDVRKKLTENHRIYMNNVMDYEGYRFFQSSFDQDERGTYLSVNHDFWGTWISYAGYFLLTVGMIMSLFSKKSRFFQLSKNIKKLRENKLLLLVVLLFNVLQLGAQSEIKQSHPSHFVDANHANKFSKLTVQDQNGRMKPIHTLSREVMRKLYKKETFEGLSADQVILGMLANSEEWINVPMIKLGNNEAIQKKLGVNTNIVAYSDFFNDDGSYLLHDEVNRAYGLKPIDRGVFEKEIMKIDEKVNIANMIYSGQLIRVIPLPGDPDNTWIGNQPSHHTHQHSSYAVATKFFEAYISSLNKAIHSNDYSYCDKIIDELAAYQLFNGASMVPSPSKINTEILLNNLNIFNRLAVLYLLLGLSFLVLLFISVFRHNVKLNRIHKILSGILIFGFLFHTLGLCLRWYISERAPWSNGYESMIYIAWTTVLAGILFTRKSTGGLAATMVLGATVLFVSNLSFLDPEITPLVPVLKSYWLTIHVSMEAGSYGFLMLGAVIGLINLILMIFISEKTLYRTNRIIKELSYLSEMTLIGGLFMISIGTYLGGVWANESWGRYWGWDAKETWALVTILVYAFILHMRIIPKLNGLFAFNFATIFGLASVIMTYFGVNYYLSGLHSYAAGDPIPIPNWVYIAVGFILVISVLAYRNKKKYKLLE